MLVDLGLPGFGSGSYPNFSDNPPSISGSNTALDAIIYGSFEEDNVFSTIFFNHFFDPQWSNGFGRPITILGVAGTTSPDWILERTQTYLEQFYSFNKAQSQLYTVLVGQSPAIRNRAMGMTFQSLGHLAHHIQDMAQPQHVRLELHAHKTVLGYNMSTAAGWYEKYTANAINSNLSALATNTWPAYQIPSFGVISQYWSSYNSSSYTGMAEFTSRNYVTFSTGYSYINSRNPPFLGNPSFPLPNGQNPDSTNRTIATFPVTAHSISTGEDITANVNYMIGAVRDDFYGGSRQNQKLAAESALQQLISQSLGSPRYFSGGDEQVWADAYPILLPRAIAFSAGVINHFFRGRVGFSRVSGTTWSLSNPTAFPMNGTYSIYAEDSAGTRAPLSGAVFTTSIAPGGSQNVVFAEPANSPVKLIVAFSGAVGTEANRVAGKVISYVAPTQPSAPPPPACLGPFKYAGNVGASSGTGTFTFLGTAGLNYKDYVMQMGSTAGAIVYNGYSTVAYQSSGMIIYANNTNKTYLGSASFTAWGTAFGPYPTGFSGVISGFNPSGQASTGIILRLYSTGMVPSSSELTVGLSCPGGTVPDLTKSFATFFVDGATSGCKSEFDFQIDGGPMKTIASQSAGLSTPLILGAHSVRVSALRTSGFCSGYNLSWGVIKYQNNQVVQRIDPGIPGTQTIIVR